MSDEQAPHPAGIPATVRLRPGLTPLRRDDECLQLGVGPGAVLVRGQRQAEVVRALAARPLSSDGDDAELVGRLWAAGALVDAAAWERDRAAWPRLADPAYAREPREAHARLVRRAGARVALDSPAAWAPELRGLLADAGLMVTEGDAAHVALVVARGEPDRRRLDVLCQRGVPHLLVRAGGDRVVLGPFVDPGRTACLRCEDAHHTDRDPRWPLLLAQLTATTAAPEAAPEPVVLTWAGAWAARELATYAEGGRPATWSARFTAEADLTLDRHALLRHPHCGCAWGELLEQAGPAA